MIRVGDRVTYAEGLYRVWRANADLLVLVGVVDRYRRCRVSVTVLVSDVKRAALAAADGREG